MYLPSLDEMMPDAPPQTADIIRDILLDSDGLSRLLEIYYLAQEPGLLDIMRGLSTLDDEDRKRLQEYVLCRRDRLLHVREFPTGAMTLELRDNVPCDDSA